MVKGRTFCPSCNKEIVLDIPDKEKKIEVVCPNCKNRFLTKIKCDDIKSKDECLWIEHGEPRKTILSSRKTKTNRPKIAGILLICVLIIGIVIIIFSETFIISYLNIASSAGITGSVKLKVIDISNNSIDNATIEINGITEYTKNDGTFNINNIKLGIQPIEISKKGYKNQTYKKLVTPFFNFESVIKLRDGEGLENKIEYNSLACSLVLIIFLVFTFLAAISCLKRKHLDIALFGCFISIFTFGFFFISSIISLIAFLLIYKSMEEFENGKTWKIF